MPYTIGDEVLVPATRVGLTDAPSALYRTSVVDVKTRSVKVNLPNQAVSDWIGTKFVHDDVGIAVVTISDMDSDELLLKPLGKSVLQFLRLLLPDDDMVRAVMIRSLYELEHFWQANHTVVSHVILIGHGSSGGIRFLVDGTVEAARLAQAFACNRAKHFTSLACQTGRNPFAAAFSGSQVCRTFIGPYHSAHGAIASMYTQVYFSLHLLGGSSEKVAYNNASTPVHGQASFRYWKNGALAGTPT